MRLPVAHCTLNPIELAWAQVKGHIKSNAKAFNLTEIEQLAREGFKVVTADRWKKLVLHVREKVEDHYWSCDGLYQQYTNRFVIQFGEESDSDDTASSDDLGSATEAGNSDDIDSDSSCSVCSCEL